MKLFNSFLVEAEIESDKVTVETPKRVSQDLVTLFGRFQPPHRGHGKTFDYAHNLAQNVGVDAPADQRFYTSRTQDKNKNLLPHEMKVDFLQRMFPKHAHKWDTDENVRTVLQSAQKAFNDGYKNLHFVGGEDRVEDIKNTLRKYNGDLYDFKHIEGHSAGERLGRGKQAPTMNMSASKLRNAVANGDLEAFEQGFVKDDNFGQKDIEELFKALQMFGRKNEELDMEEDADVRILREMYIKKEIFNVGDLVESGSTGLIGTIHRRGANHLICVTEDGIMFKNFITEVDPV